MAIVKMKNKVTGITYVYESVSYWDKEKKQPRNKKKLIGKIDPITGEVVSTHKKKQDTALALDDEERKKYADEISSLNLKITQQQSEIDKLKKTNQALINQLKNLVNQYEIK